MVADVAMGKMLIAEGSGCREAPVLPSASVVDWRPLGRVLRVWVGCLGWVQLEHWKVLVWVEHGLKEFGENEAPVMVWV